MQVPGGVGVEGVREGTPADLWLVNPRKPRAQQLGTRSTPKPPSGAARDRTIAADRGASTCRSPPHEAAVVTPSNADAQRWIAFNSRPLVAAMSGMMPHRTNVARLAAPWRSSDRVAPVSPSSRTGQVRSLHRASPATVVVMAATVMVAGRLDGSGEPRKAPAEGERSGPEAHEAHDHDRTGRHSLRGQRADRFVAMAVVLDETAAQHRREREGCRPDDRGDECSRAMGAPLHRQIMPQRVGAGHWDRGSTEGPPAPTWSPSRTRNQVKNFA